VQTRELAHAQEVENLRKQIEAAEKRKSLDIQDIRSTQTKDEEKEQKTIETAEGMMTVLSRKNKLFNERIRRNMSQLSVAEVSALLRRLGFSISDEILVKKEIDGAALCELQAFEIHSVLEVDKIGTARRLGKAIAALKSGHDLDSIFIPEERSEEPVGSPYNWNNKQVIRWLESNNLSSVVEAFRRHQITGEVLMELTRPEVVQGPESRYHLGIEKFGSASAAWTAIGNLIKAEHRSSYNPSAAALGATRVSDEELMKEIARNGDYELRLRAIQDRLDALLEGDTREIPEGFKCPITKTIMEDPVVADDGHTYERVAIEAWLKTRETSPLTNLTVSQRLIPNGNLREMICGFLDGRKKGPADQAGCV
jgi:hypothetical protein